MWYFKVCFGYYEIRHCFRLSWSDYQTVADPTIFSWFLNTDAEFVHCMLDDQFKQLK